MKLLVAGGAPRRLPNEGRREALQDRGRATERLDRAQAAG